jgi:hypothetical protein
MCFGAGCVPSKETNRDEHETELEAYLKCLEKSRFIWRNILSVYGEEALSDSRGFHGHDDKDSF